MSLEPIPSTENQYTISGTRTSPWIDDNDGTVRWYEGDTVSIDFEILAELGVNSQITDAGEYLSTAEFTAELLDIRRTPVVTSSQVGLRENNTFTFAINREQSALVTRGKYTIEVRVTKNDDFAQTLIGEKVLRVVVE